MFHSLLCERVTKGRERRKECGRVDEGENGKDELRDKEDWGKPLSYGAKTYKHSLTESALYALLRYLSVYVLVSMFTCVCL